MENIYKVRIKSNPDPRGQYPSERRYSASIVFGLSVFHLIFCALALVFALLSFLHVIPIQTEEEEDTKDSNDNVSEAVHSLTRFYLILTTSLLTLGCLLAGLTGLLAWKCWYIDNNIKWFFATSLLSSILSFASIICVIVTIVLISEGGSNHHPKVSVLHADIVILSLFEMIFSVISTGIAWAGMRNHYADDTAIPNGGGKIEVNTVTKGNKKSKISPPDIINHFHMTEKFAKYFPRKDNSSLPKAESNSEYQERVRKFLTSSNNNSDNSGRY